MEALRSHLKGRSLDEYWRIFGSGVCFGVFGIGGIILGYVILPVIALFSSSQETRRRRCRYMIHISFKAFVWLMQALGPLRWEVEGREYLLKNGCLVVANHPSLIDIVFLISLIPNATCIVKPAVFRNSFMRGPVSWAGYIPNNSPDQLVNDCVEELSQGSTLVIFPEGTRTVPGHPMRMKRGAAHIWLKSRCQLNLVTITADPPMLGKHLRWYDVPPRRSLFKLDVKQSRFADNIICGNNTNMAARAVTQQFTEYFSHET